MEQKRPQADQHTEQKRSGTAGKPGTDHGRREEAKGSGVHPASGPLPPGDAPVRGQAEWGQGSRGAEGYEDHGDSEVFPLPPETEEERKKAG